MKTQTRSTRVKVGLAAAAALGLSLVAPSVAGAQQAPEPAVTVTPADGLPAVARVMVEISGFEPEEGVFVQQCAQVSPGYFACDHEHMDSVTLDAEGSGSVSVTVRRVFEGHDHTGESVGDVDCVTAALGCFVAVANVEGGTGAMIYFEG